MGIVSLTFQIFFSKYNLVKLKLAQISSVILFIFSLQSATRVQGASSFVKYPLNPIFSPNSANWDKYGTRSPNLLNVQGYYQMLYDGNGGDGSRIGYARSLNGIDNWFRTTSPVVTPGSADGFEKETADGFIRYSNELKLYQMWFTSFDNTHWTYGLDRFRTRYATSSDGQNWIKNDKWILVGSPGSWDSGGTYRGRSVIYRNGLYQMWYTGTDDADLNVINNWRIGYATSTDGITWTKQNDGKPVIVPDQIWEYESVQTPSVIFENGVYHMFYSTGPKRSQNNPGQIVYAYSFDGVNWIKPPELNPVLTPGPVAWEGDEVTAPSIIHDGNLLKMWYTGNDGTLRIGYATASADWLPKVTPTPSPTPTLTRTP